MNFNQSHHQLLKSGGSGLSAAWARAAAQEAREASHPKPRTRSHWQPQSRLLVLLLATGLIVSGS